MTDALADGAVSAELTRFLSQHTRLSLDLDTDLFSAGGLSSLFALQIVAHLEKTYDISIRGRDLRLDYFRTIRAMCALITRLRAAQSMVERG
jgi:methoxymalonate biosynthesis acyl carrier protein